MNGSNNEEVLKTVKNVLESIIKHDGEIFGNTREECGNYRNLNLECAQLESKRYLSVLNSKKVDFKYE